MTPEEIAEVERLVNDAIAADFAIDCAEMSVEEAKNQGAIGLFESKYGEKVKVYSMGPFSREICGGPHAGRTGELKSFKIQKEESSTAGVRRIKRSSAEDSPAAFGAAFVQRLTGLFREEGTSGFFREKAFPPGTALFVLEPDGHASPMSESSTIRRLRGVHLKARFRRSPWRLGGLKRRWRSRKAVSSSASARAAFTQRPDRSRAPATCAVARASAPFSRPDVFARVISRPKATSAAHLPHRRGRQRRRDASPIASTGAPVANPYYAGQPVRCATGRWTGYHLSQRQLGVKTAGSTPSDTDVAAQDA